jgi:hypothetical protein
MTNDDIQIIRDVIENGKGDGDIASIHVERLQNLLDNYLALREEGPDTECDACDIGTEGHEYDCSNAQE